MSSVGLVRLTTELARLAFPHVEANRCRCTAKDSIWLNMEVLYKLPDIKASPEILGFVYTTFVY